MNAEKLQRQAAAAPVSQCREEEGFCLADNRQRAVSQRRMIGALQRVAEEEEEAVQGKFTAQCREDDEEVAQGKFDTVQRQEEDEDVAQGRFTAQRQEEGNRTGIPGGVKQQMEDSFGTDFSPVRVHPDSVKAPEVGALAYTQGTDIHFAPGQFRPETQAGQELLGHELTHVVQQQQGRVTPTTEIGGMPVNNDPSLEQEADRMGEKVANR